MLNTSLLTCMMRLCGVREEISSFHLFLSHSIRQEYLAYINRLFHSFISLKWLRGRGIKIYSSQQREAEAKLIKMLKSRNSEKNILIIKWCDMNIIINILCTEVLFSLDKNCHSSKKNYNKESLIMNAHSIFFSRRDSHS